MTDIAYCVACRWRTRHKRGVCVECSPDEPPVECPATIPLALFPTTPPSNGNAQSQAAADSLTEDALNEQQRRVLNALWRARPGGLTDEEIQRVTGLNPSSQRPRRGELAAGGWIEDSGATRPTQSGRKATVWRVTQQTVRAAEARRAA